MRFFDIRHLKSSDAVFVSRQKNILRRNTRLFFASESGKRYSANGSLWCAVDYHIESLYYMVLCTKCYENRTEP